jgi:hypothetical protein
MSDLGRAQFCGVVMGAGSDVLFECPVGNLEALYCLVRLISSWSISGVGVKLLLSQ